MRIAIVGTGIAGLTAAHRLHRDHEITVYEAAPRIGGHVHTVRVDLADETHEIDTGFIVHNDRNYPGFEALMAELGVATQPSRMSFSVSDDAGSFEYSGTPRGVFAQRSHLANPRFLRMIRDLLRFNREVSALATGAIDGGPSLRDLLADGGYSEWFVERLIVPQASAVWSAQPEQLWSFPAGFLASFLANHGMLGFRDRPRWRTVTGGSERYVERLTWPFADRIRTSAPVRAVTRHLGYVEVAADGCGVEHYDEVVIATHSDQALAMLTDPSPAEREILGAIPYQRNEAVLHTDSALLPRRRTARASWNYHLDGAPGGTRLTYWMNNLQSLRSDTDFCVTLNRSDRIDPEKVIEAIDYSHPVFTPEGVVAQRRHVEISGVDRTHYCGAYWGWGFHEDGLLSADRAIERMGAGVTSLPTPEPDEELAA
ncbi:MAG TPA: FAD-dependent oxidoreductase [Thermoleophilaceae bacterium]|nr:FAD-dependent oxidoreductase [Thermoleophilaceae bacterium]